MLRRNSDNLRKGLTKSSHIVGDRIVEPRALGASGLAPNFYRILHTAPRKMSSGVLANTATTGWGLGHARVIPFIARRALPFHGKDRHHRLRRESAPASCARQRCVAPTGKQSPFGESVYLFTTSLRKQSVTRVVSDSRYSANDAVDCFDSVDSYEGDLRVEGTKTRRGRDISGAGEGFVVRAKPHAHECGCDVCAKVRDLIKAADSENNTEVSKSVIFVCCNGGFVVGKQQQKHHVSGCHCPNCNHLRFRRDTGQANCVTIPEQVLHAMVGKAQCYQNVCNEGTEAQRRAKIGAANKGKIAWNKGKKHTAETIAKIRANTAIAMQNPQVKQRMRAAAANTFHSETTKLKIRRTVRDKAHQKMQARNEAKARAFGIRRGKVGVCTIGMHARRISSVQRVNFGMWTKHALENGPKKKRDSSGAVRRDERNLARKANTRYVEKRKGTRSNRGVPKSAQHKAAISAALKAKWNDPKYIASQKRANSVRTKNKGKLMSKPVSTRSIAVSPLNGDGTVSSKRNALLNEMKEIYMKALLAVRTLQEQKAAGVDVDEAMLKKAISAVAQTRKVLQSVSLDDSSEGFASFGAKSEHIRHTTEVKRS